MSLWRAKSTQSRLGLRGQGSDPTGSVANFFGWSIARLSGNRAREAGGHIAGDVPSAIWESSRGFITPSGLAWTNLHSSGSPKNRRNTVLGHLGAAAMDDRAGTIHAQSDLAIAGTKLLQPVAIISTIHHQRTTFRLGETIALSMSRVWPSQAAASRRTGRSMLAIGCRSASPRSSRYSTSP